MSQVRHGRQKTKAEGTYGPTTNRNYGALSKGGSLSCRSIATRVTKKIFAGTGAGFSSPEYQKFSKLVEDVLKKTS